MNRVRTAVAATVLTLAPAAWAQTPPPEVSVRYFPLLEPRCASMTGRALPAAEIAELRARLPEFQALWRLEGAPLVAATEKVVGVPWRMKETIAALHLCPELGTMSLPLIVDTSPYLKEGARAARLHEWVYAVYHEVLHRYVADHLQTKPGATTPLRREFDDRAYHLHLRAIEQSVYRSLGREAELKDIYAAAVARGEPTDTIDAVARYGVEKVLQDFR